MAAVPVTLPCAPGCGALCWGLNAWVPGPGVRTNWWDMVPLAPPAFSMTVTWGARFSWITAVRAML